MASVTSVPGLVHLGMDTSRDAIVVGILREGEQVPDVERIFNDESSVRRLVGRFGDPARVRACYEAGPCGYGLHRLLTSLGVACQVVAPSLIPKGAGDRVKTDRRDAVRLARLYRAGELTAIRVPSAAEEAIRDLVRVRADVPADLKRAKQRLLALLLRHGMVWRAGQYWTLAHRAWIAHLVFADPALQHSFDHYRICWAARESELAAINATLAPWATSGPLAGQVARLTGYRGIGTLTALTLASEVIDWRRFPTARAFMCFTGLTPSEYSSGPATRRGHITKAGPAATRTLLVEAAWKYRHRPAVGARLRARHRDLPAATIARSWNAQHRLHAKYLQLTGHGKIPTVAVTAIARELAGFLWAEMTSTPPDTGTSTPPDTGTGTSTPPDTGTSTPPDTGTGTGTGTGTEATG